MVKCLMDFQEVSLNAKRVFGEDYIVERIDRLYGGAQKGTYKVKCINGFTFVLYIWHKRTSFFSKYENKNDVFRSNGADLFLASHKVFEDNKVQVQKLYYINRTKEIYDFDYAFVEYISGKEIETYMDKSESEVKQLFIALGESIRKLHGIKRSFAGTIDEPQKEEFKCEEYIFSIMESEMNYLIENCNEVALNGKEIRQACKDLYAKIKPRKEYVFIHGELGPNHVLVNKNIVFIDIECAKYFDKEYENSFLEFRFGDYYKYLQEENLDMDRMKFYKLSHHIGCLSGALKLTKEDYYDMEDVNGMIKYNLEQVLSFTYKL